MRNHPAYAERPDDLALAPQDEPYVPFGVAEIHQWSLEDLRRLPPLNTVEEPVGWTWVRSLVIDDVGFGDLEAVRKQMDYWYARDSIIGFGYYKNVMKVEMVLVFEVIK